MANVERFYDSRPTEGEAGQEADRLNRQRDGARYGVVPIQALTPRPRTVDPWIILSSRPAA